MAQTGPNGKTETANAGDLPLQIRIAGIVLEQIEALTSLAPAALKDAQALYLSGVRMAFKAGEFIERRGPEGFRLVRGMREAFESSIPAIMDVQLKATSLIAESTQESLRLIRRLLGGNR